MISHLQPGGSRELVGSVRRASGVEPGDQCQLKACQRGHGCRRLDPLFDRLNCLLPRSRVGSFVPQIPEPPANRKQQTRQDREQERHFEAWLPIPRRQNDEPGPHVQYIWKLDSIQPVHKAALDHEEQCGGEVQPGNLPSAQRSVEACFPGVAHGYTCSRGAARWKKRNAATTRAKSIPNNTVSIFGLRVPSGSKGFVGSRKIFNTRFTTPRSSRCCILASNAARTSLAVTGWSTVASSQSGRRLRTVSRTSSGVSCLSSTMATAPEPHSRYPPRPPGMPA